MEVNITRLLSNHLYTEGRLHINGNKQTFTVESTGIMLPVGRYLLKLANKSRRKRELVIFYPDGRTTRWRIGLEHSHIGSRKTRTICIGQPLIPGVLYKGTPDYERIIKRLEKCQEREEKIDLIIKESICKKSHPIKHWQEPSNHGCPPTERRVELNEDDSVDIYEGDVFVKHLTIEDQKALHEA